MGVTLEFLNDCVMDASSIMVGGWESDKYIQTKGPHDYVTNIDMRVQERLTELLRKEFPEIPIVSEEMANSEYPYDATEYFCIDPIDGTTNYMNNLNDCCISLAYIKDGKPIMGVVYDPFTNEMYQAQAGRGAILNGRMILVNKCVNLSGLVIGTGTDPYRRHDWDVKIEIIKGLFTTFDDIRVYGSAALCICRVAAGRLGGSMNMNLKQWDHAAAGLILREAKGITSKIVAGSTYYICGNHEVVTNIERIITDKYFKSDGNQNGVMRCDSWL